LNKLFEPVKKFEICVFNDGAIYFEKIIKLACRKRDPNFLKKRYKNNQEKETLNTNIEFVFKNQVDA